jgi:RHS repeat-associated protein
VRGPEDPNGLNYTTDYYYDAQGNLVAAYQGYCPACQGRWFTYDSLGRLTQVSNFESGTTNYSYDANGNLTTKTDARNVITWSGYDVLNRLTSKSFNDGTPTVTYTYDDGNVPYAKSRPTSVSNANGTINYTTYDPLGRVTASNEQTAGQTYSFSYSYNLAGALTSETYPSGRVISTSYDRVNRVYSVAGSLNGQVTNYITQTAYWPHGAIYYYVRGNNLWYAASYNSRLQQIESYEAINNNSNQMLLVACPNWGVNSNAGVYDICQRASATNDNGNLQSVVMYAGEPGPASALTSFSGSFSYDGVNRLTSAIESGDWWRNFSYDQYGNMWVTGNGGAPLAGNTPTSNVYSGNRIAGASYDAAGNQLVVNGDTLTYDAENRQISAREGPALGGAMETYAYDGNGQRVVKSAPAGRTVYVYDAFGQLAAEYSNAAPSAPPPCTTCYLSYDHLGSLRMVTDIYANVVARHDYLPFGEEIPGGWAGRGATWGVHDDVAQKFTAKERDQETGLDFFGARYMSSAQGRFTSPDPHTATILHLINPQRWNMYAYGLNNPLFYTDPTGKDAIAVGFANEVPIFGHAGIISLHHDGRATYADYGPVSQGMPWDEGHTAVDIDLPKVAFDQSGNPTQASFDALTKAVAKFKGQDPKTVKMAFFKTSEADTVALDNWIQQQYKMNLVKNSQTYLFYGNSCADFCERGLMVAGAPVGMTPMSGIPNLLLWDLQAIADASYNGNQQPQQQQTSVTSQFCYTDDNGSKICQ